MEQSNPNRIQELRHARGWNQSELAEAVGAHKITISKLERGDMRLTQQWMERLAKALGVTPAEILRDSSLIRTVYVSGTICDKGSVEQTEIRLGENKDVYFEPDFELDYGVSAPNRSFFMLVQTDVYNPFLHVGDFVRFTEFSDPKRVIDDALGRICILDLGAEGFSHGTLERGPAPNSYDLRLPGGGHMRNVQPKRILVLTLAFGLPDFPAEQFSPA